MTNRKPPGYNKALDMFRHSVKGLEKVQKIMAFEEAAKLVEDIHGCNDPAVIILTQKIDSLKKELHELITQKRRVNNDE